jgi:PKD repeat protein
LRTRQTKVSFTIITAVLMLASIVIIGGLIPKVFAQTVPSITINNGAEYTNTTDITLTLSANATQMRLSLDNTTWTEWENYTTKSNATLPTIDGNYTIYGQFLDSDNNTSTAQAYIYLDTTYPDAEPYVTWYTDDYRTVYFDAYYSSDNVAIANCTWNFGDGNTTTNTTAIHIYTEVGTYDASLTVTDVAGNTAIASFTITIPDLTTVPTPTPAPTVTVQPTSMPTATPTIQPTPTPSAGLDETTLTILLISAIAVVGLILLVVVLVFWKHWKTVPPA